MKHQVCVFLLLARIKPGLKAAPAELCVWDLRSGLCGAGRDFKMTEKVSKFCLRGCCLRGELLFFSPIWILVTPKATFSSLFKVLKGSLKSRTLMFHGNKVHFSAPSKKQPQIIWIYLFIYFLGLSKKQPKFIPLMDVPRRERERLLEQLFHGLFPLPFFCFTLYSFKYKYFLLLLKYFQFLASHSLPKQ